eukprot:871048-Pelagomonas_calceolata.AAC.3
MSKGNEVTVTNDGATILKSVYIDNPAAKVCARVHPSNCVSGHEHKPSLPMRVPVPARGKDGAKRAKRVLACYAEVGWLAGLCKRARC